MIGIKARKCGRRAVRLAAVSLAGFFALVTFPVAFAQSTPAPAGAQTPAGQTPTVTEPPVIVYAQKEPADGRTLPISFTAILKKTLRDAGIDVVGDATMYSPNSFFTEFTARKLSNARFRGLGSSPNNPGVTTYVDGVPQLNSNTASFEFLDVDQVEFVRGPQSTLFGRNTLGGVINVESARPSQDKWTGLVSLPLGNFGARDVRGSISGPLAKSLSIGAGFGYGERDGFTVNDVTGNQLDTRSGSFGKGQVLWTPNAQWETRVIIAGERDRDGDYALNDLAAVRQNPFHVMRDFEGNTQRDILSTTIGVRRTGAKYTFTSTTGIVKWKTADLTDLDYTPLSLVVRSNDEKSLQFTQELRLASAPNATTSVGSAKLRWQAGAFFFTQHYDQDATNTISAFVLSPFIPFPVDQHSPLAALDDNGIGVYGQGTLTFSERLDLSGGVRVDHENKDANLQTFFFPALGAPTVVDTSKSFSNASPNVALSYRVRPDRMFYVSVGQGFKAGGFNPTSPAGQEIYDSEDSTNVEGGLKATWADGRVTTNVIVFSTNWKNLQLNVPDLNVPGQFFITNIGDATSRGVEIEVNARANSWIDVFSAIGTTRARFADGSVSVQSGVDVSGKTLPNTPDYTATFGTQIARTAGSRATIYGRAEVALYGKFQYDEANTAQQDAYSLANFRMGVRGRHVFVEGWVRNAFDTRYIPVAFSYPLFAQSGFVGEAGRPRTFGVRLGTSF